MTNVELQEHVAKINAALAEGEVQVQREPGGKWLDCTDLGLLPQRLRIKPIPREVRVDVGRGRAYPNLKEGINDFTVYPLFREVLE